MKSKESASESSLIVALLVSRAGRGDSSCESRVGVERCGCVILVGKVL